MSSISMFIICLNRPLCVDLFYLKENNTLSLVISSLHTLFFLGPETAQLILLFSSNRLIITTKLI